MVFSSIVKKIRSLTGLSQRDFAAQLQICYSLVSQYETGYRKSPEINIAKRLIKLAHKYKYPLTMDDIYQA